MIPHVIHYCWFGGKALPQKAVKCINSWKKFFPGYEIKEWNESNFNVHINDYTSEAYQAKKYAFVSDYARLWILYNHGGIYFDTDVEVVKSFDDILAEGSYMGIENNSSKEEDEINPGLGFASAPESAIIKEIMGCYENCHFINKDGSKNLYTIVSRTTDVFKKHGYSGFTNSKIKIEDFTIYPVSFFCPIEYKSHEMQKNDDTHSIHHFDASWLSPRRRFKERVKQYIRKLLK